jgi:outer membrane protein TolC
VPTEHRACRWQITATHLRLAALFLALPAVAAPAELRVEDAIRAAWQQNPGIAASAGQVAAARADAEAARDARLPKLLLSARAVATDEPMAAFGLRLDEQKIAQADFAPNRLNAPDPVGGVGLGGTIVQPLYAGGRLSAARRAAAHQVEAEASAHERRRQELALAVVEAYFGTSLAMDALRYSDDVLEHARETERFVKARNERGLLLDADVARATACRAQAEAERATAVQRLASARASLALLAGDEAGQAELVTPVAGRQPASLQPPRALDPAERADLKAARSRASAAEAAVGLARGAYLPEVLAQGSVETMRSALDQGASWFSVALVARWKLDLADQRSARAAEARAGAAEKALRWQELQARHEVEEARRAIAGADSRVASAREAMAASDSSRTLRLARHRQGLLPLTDVLDAEAALAGARALLLRSQLEARVARAQLQLASGEPVEGVDS